MLDYILDAVREKEKEVSFEQEQDMLYILSNIKLVTEEREDWKNDLFGGKFVDESSPVNREDFQWKYLKNIQNDKVNTIVNNFIAYFGSNIIGKKYQSRLLLLQKK